MKREGAFRADILTYAFNTYSTEGEHLWARLPHYAVLRHPSGKWYAIIMNLCKKKLGFLTDEYTDVLVTRCDLSMRPLLLTRPGFLPAYHLRRENWITVVLDGSVPKELAYRVLDTAYGLAGSKKTKKKIRNRPLCWIVPANPRYFDFGKAFSESDEILWKQSNNIIVGDTVYLYLTAPCSAIRYECRVTEADIPYDYDDGRIRMNRVMKLKLVKYCAGPKLSQLKEHGISTVRGPMKMPYGLNYEIQKEHEINTEVSNAKDDDSKNSS